MEGFMMDSCLVTLVVGLIARRCLEVPSFRFPLDTYTKASGYWR